MTRPRRAADYPYFDNGGLPIAFAHRGGAVDEAGIAFENTMFAFQQAVDLGYRYIETDAHVTADGVLVASHDPTLERTTDGRGVVEDHTWEELTRLKVGGQEAIPRFDDMLTTWPDVLMNIDAKTHASVECLAKTIHRHRAWDRVCVASFSTASLLRLRRMVGPRVASSMGRVEVAILRLLPGRAARARLLRDPTAAQVPTRRVGVEIVTRQLVDRAHEMGKLVHVWTIDDPAEMRRLLDLGVDGIFTDRVDLLRDVFVERGVWAVTDR